jgi:hypothetical protein
MLINSKSLVITLNLPPPDEVAVCDGQISRHSQPPKERDGSVQFFAPTALPPGTELVSAVWASGSGPDLRIV